MQNLYKISCDIPKHHAINLGSIFLACEFLNLNLSNVSKNLENYSPIVGRGKNIPLLLNNKNIILIDDSYNANPASMKSALENLSLQKSKRKIAVLSDMRELGDNEDLMHKDVGLYINNLDIDYVITSGVLSKKRWNTHEQTNKRR